MLPPFIYSSLSAFFPFFITSFIHIPPSSFIIKPPPCLFIFCLPHSFMFYLLHSFIQTISFIYIHSCSTSFTYSYSTYFVHPDYFLYSFLPHLHSSQITLFIHSLHAPPFIPSQPTFFILFIRILPLSFIHDLPSFIYSLHYFFNVFFILREFRCQEKDD